MMLDFKRNNVEKGWKRIIYIQSFDCVAIKGVRIKVDDIN